MADSYDFEVVGHDGGSPRPFAPPSQNNQTRCEPARLASHLELGRRTLSEAAGAFSPAFSEATGWQAATRLEEAWLPPARVLETVPKGEDRGEPDLRPPASWHLRLGLGLGLGGQS